MTRREWLQAVAVVAAITGAVVLLWRWNTFRYFFTFPDGAAVGNYAADGALLAVGTTAGAVLRKPLGRLVRRVRAKWHEETREHLGGLRAELSAMEARLTRHADARHVIMMEHVTAQAKEDQ